MFSSSSTAAPTRRVLQRQIYNTGDELHILRVRTGPPSLNVVDPHPVKGGSYP